MCIVVVVVVSVVCCTIFVLYSNGISSEYSH